MYRKNNSSSANSSTHYERWENPINERYYTVYLNRDLLGDWVITRAWGSKQSAKGKIVHTPYLSRQEAIKFLEVIQKKRYKKGYHKITSSGCYN